MSDEEGAMGKLILLRRMREEAERRALARAAEREVRARSEERLAEKRGRQAARDLWRAEREDAGERPLAQILQFQSRSLRQLRAMLESLERAHAAARGERIGASEASDQVRASLAAARRARELLQERLASARRDRRRRRQGIEDEAREDRGRPRDDGEG